MRTTKAWLITDAGESTEVELVPGTGSMLETMYQYLECRTVDMVAIDRDLDVWMDDEGTVTGSPINLVGTRVVAALAGRSMRQWLHGHLLFMGRDGDDAAGLQPADLERLRELTERVRSIVGVFLTRRPMSS